METINDLRSIALRLAHDPNRLGELLRSLLSAPGGRGFGLYDNLQISESFWALNPHSEAAGNLMMWLSEERSPLAARKFFEQDMGRYPSMVSGPVFAGWFSDGDMVLAFDVGPLMDSHEPVGLISNDAKKTNRWRFVTQEQPELLSPVVPSLDDPLPTDMTAAMASKLVDPSCGIFNLALLLAGETSKLKSFSHLAIRIEEVAGMALEMAPLAGLNYPDMLLLLKDIEALVAKALMQAPSDSGDEAALRVMAEHLTHYLPAKAA